MKLFSIDSKLYALMTTLWDVVKLNFMWLLFSLPIITIGSATVAAFSVTLKMVENREGHVVSQFITAFKENWKQGIPLGLFTLMTAYFVYLNIEFFNKIENSTIFFLIAAMFVGFIGLFHLLYSYAIIARYESTVFQAMINSRNISTKYFLRTLLLWIIIAVLIVVFLFNYTLIFIGLLIGPVSIFMTISAFAMTFFREIDRDAKS